MIQGHSLEVCCMLLPLIGSDRCHRDKIDQQSCQVSIQRIVRLAQPHHYSIVSSTTTARRLQSMQSSMCLILPPEAEFFNPFFQSKSSQCRQSLFTQITECRYGLVPSWSGTWQCREHFLQLSHSSMTYSRR